jgi:hypothetical protein
MTDERTMVFPASPPRRPLEQDAEVDVIVAEPEAVAYLEPITLPWLTPVIFSKAD